MHNLRDRLLLLVSAVGVSSVLVLGVFALAAVGLGEHWVMLWLYSILLFVVLLPTALFEMRRRSRKLRRKWPLVAATLVFLVGHIVILSNLLRAVGTEWGMPHFYFMSIIECIAFGVLFEQAYVRSVSIDRRSGRTDGGDESIPKTPSVR